MISTSSSQLRCLCGAVSEPGTLLSDAELPTLSQLCHCNVCRRSTGALGASFPKLKASPSPQSLVKMTDHRSSENTSRYFCSTCGCHCFTLNREKNRWSCLGGIIEVTGTPDGGDGTSVKPKNVVSITCHEYVSDTLDGGLAPLLLHLDGRPVPTWSKGLPLHHQPGEFDLPHATALSLPTRPMQGLPMPTENSTFRAECHCRGVSLVIKRADYGAESTAGAPARGLSTDPTKYLTYCCACRSCRLSTGVSLVPFTLIPPSRIFNAGGSAEGFALKDLVPIHYGYTTSQQDSNQGLTLGHYWSSPDVCRSFCTKCGASVFYWCGKRPDEVDVAVGILQSEEGSMCRRWLEWEWGRCSFVEEGTDMEVCDAWSKSAETVQS